MWVDLLACNYEQAGQKHSSRSRPSSQLLQPILVLIISIASLHFVHETWAVPTLSPLLEGPGQRIARHKTWRTKHGVGRQLEGAATTEYAQESCRGPA